MAQSWPGEPRLGHRVNVTCRSPYPLLSSRLQPLKDTGDGVARQQPYCGWGDEPHLAGKLGGSRVELADAPPIAVHGLTQQAAWADACRHLPPHVDIVPFPTALLSSQASECLDGERATAASDVFSFGMVSGREQQQRL